MGEIGATAFAVVGSTVLRTALICGNWKWVLEGCVCVSISRSCPVGMEASSYQNKPFNDRGTLCPRTEPLPSSGNALASWVLGQQGCDVASEEGPGPWYGPGWAAGHPTPLSCSPYRGCQPSISPRAPPSTPGVPKGPIWGIFRVSG